MMLLFIACTLALVKGNLNLSWTYASQNISYGYGYGCTTTVEWTDDHQTVYIIGCRIGTNVLYAGQYLNMDGSSIHNAQMGNITMFNYQNQNMYCPTQSTMYNPNDGLIYLVTDRAGGTYKGVHKLSIYQNQPSQVLWHSDVIPMYQDNWEQSCSALDIDSNIIINFGI